MSEPSTRLTLSLCTEKTQKWEELVRLSLQPGLGGGLPSLTKALADSGKQTLLDEVLQSDTVFSIRREFEGNQSTTTYLPFREVHFEFGTATPSNPEEWKSNIGYVTAKLRDVTAGRYQCVEWQKTKPAVYVVGHTDTVGSKAANQTLSEKRAGAIAEALHRDSPALEICFAGRGEMDAGTKDEMESAEARRAQVTVSSGEPPMEAQWRCLVKGVKGQ